MPKTKKLITFNDRSIELLSRYQNYKTSEIVRLLVELLDEAQDRENIFKIINTFKNGKNTICIAYFVLPYLQLIN